MIGRVLEFQNDKRAFSRYISSAALSGSSQKFNLAKIEVSKLTASLEDLTTVLLQNIEPSANPNIHQQHSKLELYEKNISAGNSFIFPTTASRIDLCRMKFYPGTHLLAQSNSYFKNVSKFWGNNL